MPAGPISARPLGLQKEDSGNPVTRVPRRSKQRRFTRGSTFLRPNPGGGAKRFHYCSPSRPLKIVAFLPGATRHPDRRDVCPESTGEFSRTHPTQEGWDVGTGQPSAANR